MIVMADTYTPNSGMKAAARRALKWKEDGKATGAGTPVGWGRATDIVNGSAMSLDTVKRMYSFFSRHEVDKKGKDFYNTSNPSNGRIMWDAWGGDAGFSWSRAIVNRNKEASDLFMGFGQFIPGAERLTEVFDLSKKENFGNVIGNRKGKPADKELYARVVAAAKKKFKVYPSAYANGWVVQEYKRRGGTYN
jgi:hypothetical protein